MSLSLYLGARANVQISQRENVRPPHLDLRPSPSGYPYHLATGKDIILMEISQTARNESKTPALKLKRRSKTTASKKKMNFRNSRKRSALPLLSSSLLSTSTPSHVSSDSPQPPPSPPSLSSSLRLPSPLPYPSHSKTNIRGNSIHPATKKPKKTPPPTPTSR